MDRSKISKITKIAISIALVALLGLTPLGYINLGFLQITTVHVVVILIALTFGLEDGLIAGLTFGVTSIITAITTPNFFSPIFYNPLVSVLPRVAFAAIVYGLFVFMKYLLKSIPSEKMRLSISAAVSAAIATLLHSLMVMGLIWIFRGMSKELTPEMLNTSLVTIATINMPSEILVATIVSAIAIPVLYPLFNKHKVALDEQEQKLSE